MKTKPNSRNYVKKAILSLLVPCCLLQIGCTAPSDEEGSVTPPPPPPVYFAENGRSDYTVVSAMGSDGYDMADKFRSCFAAATGIELEYRPMSWPPQKRGDGSSSSAPPTGTVCSPPPWRALPPTAISCRWREAAC